MKQNRIRLTESQLHRVIKESVNKVLKEYFFFNQQNTLSPEEKKKNEMDSDWEMYGNLGRMDNPHQTLSGDEHFGLMAQHKHNSINRAGARGIKNGTLKSGINAAADYNKKHR